MWCRGWESNPHDPFGSQDFKSCASASFATPARENSLNFTRSGDAVLASLQSLLYGLSPIAMSSGSETFSFRYRAQWVKPTNLPSAPRATTTPVSPAASAPSQGTNTSSSSPSCARPAATSGPSRMSRDRTCWSRLMPAPTKPHGQHRRQHRHPQRCCSSRRWPGRS
jgi:hypothetical protein